MGYLLTLLILSVFVVLLILPYRLNLKFKYSESFIQFNIVRSYLFGIVKSEINPYEGKKGNSSKLSKLLRMENKKLFNYIWDKLSINKLIWHTSIGLLDAAATGIVYGIVWGLKTILIDFILKSKEIKNININVLPIYNKDNLDIEFNCIFEIKLAHIIIIWLWIFKIYKGGDRIDRTSNRRFNENYNE